MNRELFGVFGDVEAFERFRSREEFDAVLAGSTVTVGLRDPDLGTPGWSACHSGDAGCCCIWGEVYVPGDDSNAARWLLEQYETDGRNALERLNGSYLAVLDHEVIGDAFVVTDPVRSRECFYTTDPDVRIFGTDAAEVARTITKPTFDRDGILEFLHLGLMLGEKTAVTELRRLPIDSRLTPTSVDSLDRFRYQPTEFDYVGELADRLERALERRRSLPGRKGVLLSAGYDSRIILSQLPEIAHSYTVGSPDAQEVRGARCLASQYDTDHTAFSPDERYLRPDESKVRYSQGIKESLHIHHAGYTDEIDAETMYHGLLCDTFFRGHFTAAETVDVVGKRVPTGRLDPDPDPVETLLEKFGYSREASLELADRTSFDVDPEAFVSEAVADEFDARKSRANGAQNALSCCGIANQPSVPFHTHLSDHFVTSFLATDRELIDWHLRTPPAHRTTETFLRACELLDSDVLRHRPPDRPHDMTLLNEIEGFFRRKVPLLSSFEPPWPDRTTLFDRYELDRHSLADLENVHGLPARHKLRVIDLRSWVQSWAASRVRSLPWLQPEHDPTAESKRRPDSLRNP
ncbi:asparagine synthase-related protein [Natrialbaceae archaeon AArc-T1-2]|uniref:asparagine synthase-related protein n=1 Tax=Natrialbaceae archaeon AArc-T1-2 TaxID=3053904 RepID=UPI00255AD307|nr:asparagine synthase-related protein [Natrialbaceae archaeon AArc-T1-2]WIV67425.1 asparagine synthase-related protein [Natrialbaceae archaeon AArc-T1-2]